MADRTTLCCQQKAKLTEAVRYALTRNVILRESHGRRTRERLDTLSLGEGVTYDLEGAKEGPALRALCLDAANVAGTATETSR